jgi:hypothetical protein
MIFPAKILVRNILQWGYSNAWWEKDTLGEVKIGVILGC